MAGSLNKVILIGRVGQDPKVALLPSGSPVAELSVATDESFKDRDGSKRERVEWHRVKVFGRSAEFVERYIGKGRLVYVEGTLRTRSWEDQQGQKRYTTEVVVTAPGHTIQALDSKPADAQSRQSTPPQSARQQPAQQQDDGPAFPSDASGMDDVPFALILAPFAALAMAAMQGGWVC